MSESIELQVNLNTLVRDGWSVEMETGMRGGQVRSWVKLRHFERGLLFKVRSAPMELKDALAAAMREARIEPFLHWRAVETNDGLWNPYGNDGMRHMEGADVTGGATDMTGRCTHGTKHTDGDGCPHCPR